MPKKGHHNPDRYERSLQTFAEKIRPAAESDFHMANIYVNCIKEAAAMKRAAIERRDRKARESAGIYDGSLLHVAD